MRLRILALTAALLALAMDADAKGLWIGPQLAFPVPAGDVGDAQLGLDAGVTLDYLKDSHGGVGVDLIYHYWPASPSYKAKFDDYLASTRFQVIDGSTWAFSALQATVHVKFVASIDGRHRPWVQIGGGAYRIDRNLTEPNWAGSTVIVVGGNQSNVTTVPGWYGSIGFDVRIAPKTLVGIGAEYHHVLSDAQYRRLSLDTQGALGFSAITVGTHLLFGW